MVGTEHCNNDPLLKSGFWSLKGTSYRAYSWPGCPLEFVQIGYKFLMHLSIWKQNYHKT